MSNYTEQLKNLPTPELVRIWNQLMGATVKRFADRKSGLVRFERATQNPVIATKLTAMLTTKIVVSTTGEESPKVKRRKTKAGPAPAIKPIEGSKQGRVNVAGRAVLPKNTKRVLAGEFIAGVTLAPPKPGDALKGKSEGLNLNYKRKTVVKPLRAGTDRERLVGIMSKNGVTVDDVMKLFSLNYDQAVYRLRDLHYTAGHGVVVREGRVFLNDET